MQIMESVDRDLHLWEIVESDKLKNEFEQSNRILETISKSLSEYLEIKR